VLEWFDKYAASGQRVLQEQVLTKIRRWNWRADKMRGGGGHQQALSSKRLIYRAIISEGILVPCEILSLEQHRVSSDGKSVWSDYFVSGHSKIFFPSIWCRVQYFSLCWPGWRLECKLLAAFRHSILLLSQSWLICRLARDTNWINLRKFPIASTGSPPTRNRLLRYWSAGWFFCWWRGATS